MNCTQTLTLRGDGTASVMFTDIMNSATYQITGKKLVVKRSTPGDMPEKMVFTMDETGRNLISSDLKVWELEQACE